MNLATVLDEMKKKAIKLELQTDHKEELRSELQKSVETRIFRKTSSGFIMREKHSRGKSKTVH